MANEVRADIVITAKANTSQAQSEINQLSDVVKNTIELVKNQFAAINYAITDGLNKPIENSKEYITELENAFAHLCNNTLSLEGLVPDAQFYKALELVDELRLKIDELKSRTNNGNASLFADFGESAQRELNILSDTIPLYDEKTEKTKTLEETLRDIAKNIYGEEEAEEKLNQAFMKSNDILGGVKVSAEDVEESLQRMSVDGSAFKDDLENVGDGLKQNVDNSKNAGSANNELASAVLNANIAYKLLGEAVKYTKEEIEYTIKTLEGMGGAFIDVAEFGVDVLKESFETLIGITEEALDKLQEFAEVGADIQTAYFNMYTIVGKEAGDSIGGFTEKLEELYGLSADGLIEDMQSIIAAAGSLAVNSDDMVRATENMTIMAENLSIIAGGFDKASQDIGNAISKGYIGRNSSLYVLLTKNEKDALKSLGSEVERYNFLMEKSERIKGRYLDYLNTEAGKVMLLRNQYRILMDNIGKLALNLYARIAPLLTKLLELANRALSSLAKVFNIDIKESSKNTTGSIAENITKDLNNLSKASEEAKRNIASFDDVIQINNNDDSSNESLDNLSDIDLSNILEIDEAINKLDDDWNTFLNDIENAIKEGRWEDVGRLIADKLMNWMEGIDWNNIKQKAKKFGSALARIFNGLFEDKTLFKDIGNFFAEAINTAFTYLYVVASDFDWKNFGEGLITGWNSFWNKLDTKVIAGAAYKWFIGVIRTIKAFVSSGDTSMGETLAELINEFFFGTDDNGNENFDEQAIQDISDSIINGIDFIFNNVDKFFDELNTDKIKEKIKMLIEKLVSGFGEKSEDWGETVGNIIKGILDIATELMMKADNSGLSDAIKTFLDSVDIPGIMWSLFKTKTEEKRLLFESLGKTIIELIVGGLLMTLGDAIVNIGLIGGQLLEYIGEAIIKVGNILFAFGVSLFAQCILIGTKISEWWTGTVIPWFDNVKITISEKWDDIKEKGKEIWKSITKFFSPETWRKLGSSALNNLWNGIKSIWTSIKQWWNTNVAKNISFKTPDILGGKTISFGIPKLATGGIVTRSTIANIGEAGKEAVLPLDRNTSWMDELASKIASKISGESSVSGGNITIDMSGYVKNFYTRSEMLEFGKQVVEALKVYGVNVAVVS